MRARLFVTAKMTTNRTIPGFAEPVPVTTNPTAILALYDDKGHAGSILDDDSITFIKSRASLAGGVLVVRNPDETSGVTVSPYSVGLSDAQGFEAALGRRALTTPLT